MKITGQIHILLNAVKSLVNNFQRIKDEFKINYSRTAKKTTKNAKLNAKITTNILIDIIKYPRSFFNLS